MATKGRGMQQFIRVRHLRTHEPICEICGYRGLVIVHHKIPISKGGTNDESNLIVLCEKCHADAHGEKKKKYLDPNCANWNGSN